MCAKCQGNAGNAGECRRMQRNAMGMYWRVYKVPGNAGECRSMPGDAGE